MQTFVNVPPVLTPGNFTGIDLSLKGFAEEPSLFSCGIPGVRSLGGPMAKRSINQIQNLYAQDIRRAEEAGLSPVIDVRVQRLMPGQYPSIPGWHCDAVPRCSYHGQPNFAAINPAAFHVVVLLSTEHNGVSSTEFVTSTIKPKLWDKEHVYKDLHNEVERIKPESLTLKDGVFAKFTPKSVHRTSPTHRRGWRMFMRFSMYHKPPIENAVSSSQQVYILSEENGW